MRIKLQRMVTNLIVGHVSDQKRTEVANKLKQMRRGAKPKKPPKVQPPKVPNYSEIFKSKKNNQA